jgi:uncharacterized protein YsxB (DUF464 family)
VINVEPNQHDSFTWIVVMKGHDNTMHQGKTIRLLVDRIPE